MPELFSFEENDRFFIKFFLLDASLNLNQWGVTENSLKANLDTFLGKPFVMTDDADHPEARTGDDLLVRQEHFRVGNIISVGFDQKTHKAFGVAEIKEDEAKERIKGGEISFVSPSIIFSNDDVHFQMDGTQIIHRWEGAHVAGVKDPAFGMYKAQIKGQCNGDEATCEKELAMVQASKADKILTFYTATQTLMVQASKCVEDCIQSKSDEGIEIDDQALAICFSKCGESKKSNIDPQSLENITKIDLLKKKKAVEVNEPGKPNKKCNIDPDLPCTMEENASLKHTTKNVKSMTKAQTEDEEKMKKMNDNAEDEEEKKEEGQVEDEERKEGEEHEDEKKEGEEHEDKKKEAEEHEDKIDARIKDLEIKLANKDKEPYVSQIVKAKVEMGQLKELGSAKASNELFDLPLSLLKSMAADYSKMSTITASPKLPYTTLYASRGSGGGHDMDKLLAKVKDY